MHNSERQTLAAECGTFSAYLTNQEPSPYIVDKYCEAHAAGNFLAGPQGEAFDTVLMRLAMLHPFFTRLVDLYTSLLFKRAVVRKKLVLLLAILESASTTHAYFDSTDSLGKLEFGLKTVGRGIASGLMLILALVSIWPLHLGLRAMGHGARSNERYAPRA